MLNLIIDVNTLTLKKQVDSADELIQFVQTLMRIRELSLESWICVFFSESSVSTMFKSGSYPITNELRSAIEVHNIREFSADTVVTLLNTILNNRLSFEETFGMSGLVVENVRIPSDWFNECDSPEVIETFAELVIAISILSKYDSYFGATHIFVTNSLSSDRVEVSAEILVIEHDRKDLFPRNLTSERFSSEINACNNLESVFVCVDPLKVLAHGKDWLDIQLSIRLSLFAHGSSSGFVEGRENFSQLRFTESFFESCRKLCRELDTGFPKRFLRSIVETVNREKLQSVHGVRRSHGGGSGYLTRDKDRAIRRDVDKDIHLHYWDCEDGTIELVDVSHHDDRIKM